MAVISSCFSYLETKHKYIQGMHSYMATKAFRNMPNMTAISNVLKWSEWKKTIFLFLHNLAQILFPSALGHISVCYTI